MSLLSLAPKKNLQNRIILIVFRNNRLLISYQNTASSMPKNFSFLVSKHQLGDKFIWQVNICSNIDLQNFWISQWDFADNPFSWNENSRILFVFISWFPDDTWLMSASRDKNNQKSCFKNSIISNGNINPQTAFLWLK